MCWSCATERREPCQAGNRAALSGQPVRHSPPAHRVTEAKFFLFYKAVKKYYGQQCFACCILPGVPIADCNTFYLAGAGVPCILQRNIGFMLLFICAESCIGHGNKHRVLFFCITGRRGRRPLQKESDRRGFLCTEFYTENGDRGFLPM